MRSYVTHLYDQAVSWLAQTDPTHREILYASLFLFFLFITGTVGYHFSEGWGWFDGFYQTFVTITTIGFGEVEPLSKRGRVFTVLLAVIGIGTVGVIGTRIAQMLVSSQHLRERHMKQRIERTSDHYVLCGYGTVGARIARDLNESGERVVVIENDPEVIEEIKENTDLLLVEGDAEEENVVEEAGIARAHGLVLALPEDSANVFVTLMARELNPDIFILARTGYHRNRRKLLNAGADKVIAPDEVGADRMAQVILRPTVDQFMENVLRTGALGLEMEEAVIEDGSLLAGSSLADSNFRQEFEAIVIGIKDHDSGEMNFNPHPQDELEANDTLVVLGNNEMIERLQQEGCTA